MSFVTFRTLDCAKLLLASWEASFNRVLIAQTIAQVQKQSGDSYNFQLHMRTILNSRKSIATRSQ